MPRRISCAWASLALMISLVLTSARRGHSNSGASRSAVNQPGGVFMKPTWPAIAPSARRGLRKPSPLLAGFAAWRADGGAQHPAPILLRTDDPRHRLANLLETGEIPEIRKIPALLRLHRLHGAIVAVEKNALAVWLVRQRQADSIAGEPGELLNELHLAHDLERREARDLGIPQAHLPRPATASRATLALMEDRHGESLSPKLETRRPKEIRRANDEADSLSTGVSENGNSEFDVLWNCVFRASISLTRPDA